MIPLGNPSEHSPPRSPPGICSLPQIHIASVVTTTAKTRCTLGSQLIAPGMPSVPSVCAQRCSQRMQALDLVPGKPSMVEALTRSAQALPV